MNCTNITTDHQALVFRPSYIIDPIWISLYLYQLVKLITKYWHTMEPVHVYEINSMGDLTIIIIQRAVTNIEPLISPHSSICLLSQFVGKVSRWSLMADISMSQVDLFLALYWNAEYKARVTTRLATVVTVTSKIVAALVASIMILVDPSEFNCHNINGRRFVCTYYRRNNIFYFTIPISVCVIVACCTSIYIFKVVRKIQASAAIVENAKAILKMNLLTLCILLMMLPPYLVHIYVYIHGATCDNDPNLTIIAPALGFISFLSICSYPFIVKRKLQKIASVSNHQQPGWDG